MVVEMKIVVMYMSSHSASLGNAYITMLSLKLESGYPEFLKVFEVLWQKIFPMLENIQ